MTDEQAIAACAPSGGRQRPFTAAARRTALLLIALAILLGAICGIGTFTFGYGKGWSYLSSENLMGFHADQEAMRILGESIDYSRQAQAMALRLRAPAAPEPTRAAQPVEGVTPSEKAPRKPSEES